jgi:F-type H+-transporting ATPase subunit b
VLALLAFATPLRADSAPADKDKHSHGPDFFVKDGDNFRPATEAEKKSLAGGDHVHEKSGGLDFTGIKRWDLGIYTLIVFFLLVAIVWKFAWPHIKTGLEKRETNIRSALDEAKKDREESKLALAAAKRQLDETAAQVKGMLDEARRDADVLKASERDVGAKEAQAERERARREIENLKAGLSKEVYEQAVKLASLMAEKAIRRQVSIEDHHRLLDESLTELKSAANKA